MKESEKQQHIILDVDDFDSVVLCTRSTFYKGQADFQLVLYLRNLPKLTSFVPCQSLTFKYLIFGFYLCYGYAYSLPICFQLLVPWYFPKD